ncbi:MAG: hypothetical protein RR743_02815 [Oscillospiraceae bacterium]
MINEIIKFAGIGKQEITESELALVNKQSLKTLTAEEIYTFKIAACDNVVDRDYEHFTDEMLETLAKLFVGKTVISDHNWSAALQTARIYAGDVVAVGTDGTKKLMLRAYMLKNQGTLPVIEAIEGGILREVSVGCTSNKAICSICGINKRLAYCEHRPGKSYEGKLCTVALDDASDAYEVSFVAVPAQPAAGVTKSYGGEDKKPEQLDDHKKAPELEARLRKAKIQMIKNKLED